jgi:hypothetical protein
MPNNPLDPFLDGFYPKPARSETPSAAPRPAPSGVEIGDDFRRAFELIEAGEPFVFVTGKAGTGKSTFIHALKEMTSRNLALDELHLG